MLVQSDFAKFCDLRENGDKKYLSIRWWFMNVSRAHLANCRIFRNNFRVKLWQRKV